MSLMSRKSFPCATPWVLCLRRLVLSAASRGTSEPRNLCTAVSTPVSQGDFLKVGEYSPCLEGKKFKEML